MNAGRGQWLSIICTVLTLLFGIAALFAFCLRHLPQKVTLPITLWLFRADDIIIAGGEDPQMGSGLAILSAGIELLALLLIAAAAWKAGQSFMHRASGETASKDSAMFWYFCGWLLVVTLKIGLDNLFLLPQVLHFIIELRLLNWRPTYRILPRGRGSLRGESGMAAQSRTGKLSKASSLPKQSSPPPLPPYWLAAAEANKDIIGQIFVYRRGGFTHAEDKRGRALD